MDRIKTAEVPNMVALADCVSTRRGKVVPFPPQVRNGLPSQVNAVIEQGLLVVRGLPLVVSGLFGRDSFEQAKDVFVDFW